MNWHYRARLSLDTATTRAVSMSAGAYLLEAVLTRKHRVKDVRSNRVMTLTKASSGSSTNRFFPSGQGTSYGWILRGGGSIGSREAGGLGG